MAKVLMKAVHAQRLLLGLALLGLLLGPFLLRPQSERAPHSDLQRHLIILTPHNQHIRDELGRAFIRHWKQRTGEDVAIDWRIPGGASEIMLYLKAEFAQAFDAYIKRQGHAQGGVAHEQFARSAEGTPSAERQLFLASNVGIGIDLLFGGGAFEFAQLARSGYFDPGDPLKGTGIREVRRQHPEWFREDVFPEHFGGETFRDRDDLWVGVVLAGFGILYNHDSLLRMGVERPPSQWSDLGHPQFLGEIGLADPSKSGSAAKAFELIIQQQIQLAMRMLKASPGSVAEQQAIEVGWQEGFRLIQRLAANARYFSDSATKIALEVSRGDSAAGMAIDTYGRTTQDFVRDDKGRSRIGFQVPKDGSSLSADPIAMLRGAPHPDLATGFIAFVLSPEGQALWGLRPGVAGGPQHAALRRLPIRMDFYRDANRLLRSDPGDDPYRDMKGFVYHPEWTASLFPVIRFLIRNVFVDAHLELQSAYAALKARAMPAEAVAVFDDLDAIGLKVARNEILPVLRRRDRLSEVRLARALLKASRERYLRVKRMSQLRGN